MQIGNSTGLASVFQALATQAKSTFQSGQPFKVSANAGTAAASGQGPVTDTLTGNFQYTEVEVAGDNSLFTPGEPNAPDAGKQSFANALESFLALVQAGQSSSGAYAGPSSYETSTSFVGNGGREAISWSGEFSLSQSGSTTSKSP